MNRPHLHSIADIREMLTQRVDEVAHYYAPPAQGSYEDKGLYFTLNPGRVDKSVGSFWVTLKAGRWQGHWKDKATGQGGDLLDLIALAMNYDMTGAIKEAKLYLGLMTDTPADAKRRAEAAEASRARRAEAERLSRLKAQDRSKQAQAIWLSAQAKIAGTPVEYYLRDARGIDLAKIGRQPSALRYQAKCYYSNVDADGVFTEGKMPAMVAAISDIKGNMVAVHRTWLAIGPDGKWGKAPLVKSKKVLAEYGGAAIRIWTGTGLRGGKAAPLNKCPPETHVFISEGIEDALSCVMQLPEVRVIAAISVDNLGTVKLPPNVAKVTLVADRDEGAQASEALQNAIAAHHAAGRRVAVWMNQSGGKDLNDALLKARESEEMGDDQGKDPVR